MNVAILETTLQLPQPIPVFLLVDQHTDSFLLLGMHATKTAAQAEYDRLNSITEVSATTSHIEVTT